MSVRFGLRDVVIALLLVALVPLLVWPHLYQDFPTLRAVDGKGWSPDEGTVLHNADRLRQGDVLYAEYFDFKGPLGLVPFALAFALDEPGVATGRIAMFLVLGLLTAVVYLAAASLVRSRAMALVIASLIPLVAFPCWPFAYQDLLGAAFTLAAVPLLVDVQNERPLIAGALVGCGLWTSLAHGAPALLALGSAIALRAYVLGSARDALRRSVWFAGGALAATLPVCAAFAALGALDDLLWCTFVFPFAYYRAPINVVEYGFDAAGYVAAWSSTDPTDGRLAALVCRSALALPKLALASSLLVAVALLVLVARRVARGRPLYELGASSLLRMIVPAALGAVAVPVVLGWTRADLGHIGFVIPESLIAVSAVSIPAQLARAGLLCQLGRRALHAAALLALVGGFAFHVRQASRPFARVDPDTDARAVFGIESLDIWTRPGDEIASPIYGGYTFLVSGRKNATRFATLWRELARYQWRIAADDIVARRPKVLRASAVHVAWLSRLRPEIVSMYSHVGELYVRRDLLGR